MTDKLHCPFCGVELEQEQGSDGWFYCVNAKCCYKYTTTYKTIWQALIDGKKAQDALKKVKTHIKSAIRVGRDNNLYSECRVDGMLDFLWDADKEITSITKQAE